MTNDTVEELILRCSVIKAQDLVSKDSNGFSDPYAIVSNGKDFHSSEVVPKNLNPEWDFTCDLTLTPGDSQISIVLWDKDSFKSDFLGQISFDIKELFNSGQAIAFLDENNEPRWYDLLDRDTRRSKILRRKKKLADQPKPMSSGKVLVKFGLVEKYGAATPDNWESTWDAFLNSAACSDAIEKPDQPSTADQKSQNTATAKRALLQKYRTASNKSIDTSTAKFHGEDLMGIMYIEVTCASDLPPEKNVIHTSFDMDPFVVVTFGRSTFRTKALRHTLNPTWNEKLYFHVNDDDVNYKLKFSVYDKDKVSGNDYVAGNEVSILDIIDKSLESGKLALKPASTVGTGNKCNNDEDHIRLTLGNSSAGSTAKDIESDMEMHTIDLKLANQVKWEGRHQPTLTFRAKYVPYEEIRKMFWLTLTKTYDADSNGRMSHMEVQTMLESLGSTISDSTIDEFWSHFNKTEDQELEFEELIDRLEAHIVYSDRRRRETKKAREPTEGVERSDTSNSLFLDPIKFYQYDSEMSSDNFNDNSDSEDTLNDKDQASFASSDHDEPIAEAHGVQYGVHDNHEKTYDVNSDKEVKLKDDDVMENENDNIEKVIHVKECPICHRPNLNRKSQMDIITHIATCAADDWTTVDKFVMGNFITEAYAQRKWFVKMISKVGYGKYSVGTDNANIIVQDRQTGQLIEEKMAVYVRLGMRLLYRGSKTTVHTKRAQKILENMSIKQGKRFDSPMSARDIKPFIQFHKLDMTEVLDPMESFKTFNQFFYRKLKPDARPCDSADDAKVAVSAADARMMAFATIDDATRIWIKGLSFSVGKLLGDEELGKSYVGGSLAIFRLAPQDYHRFHSPVDGVVSEVKHIPGQYYTVNPMAIRTTLDVYGENTRSVLSIDSPTFGKVAVACIGAMMVGSIEITAKPGSTLKRTDELGYFAFGGSTLVAIFPPNSIQFDKDLLMNAQEPLETLTRVGQHIGKAVSK
ncbi:hypothetical protein NQZ79_g5719 [Umbelopsis isabellina]|nr:hypothetical protein NQZ79_g5719 [Umbelopsis isabellina]